jgi:hypothetical protein
MSLSRFVRTTTQAAWPAVKTSLEIHNAQRRAVKADPHGATQSARSRAEKPWSRVVAEETVWALAKQGLVCSEEQHAVVEAAKAWVRAFGNDVAGDPDAEPEDVELYRAVQALASAVVPESLDEAAVG